MQACIMVVWLSYFAFKMQTITHTVNIIKKYKKTIAYLKHNWKYSFYESYDLLFPSNLVLKNIILTKKTQLFS